MVIALGDDRSFGKRAPHFFTSRAFHSSHVLLNTLHNRNFFWMITLFLPSIRMSRKISLILR